MDDSTLLDAEVSHVVFTEPPRSPFPPPPPPSPEDDSTARLARIIPLTDSEFSGPLFNHNVEMTPEANRRPRTSYAALAREIRPLAMPEYPGHFPMMVSKRC